MRGRHVLTLIAVLAAAAHLCHVSVLWADDNLPLAAAMQVARGKILYRDIWFDKPPLIAWLDLAWGARAGILLRLAGAAYVVMCAAAALKLLVQSKWSEREGVFAAVFIAFFLTFGLPSAVIPLASDMLLVLPHILAIHFAWRGRAFWSGAAAGVGLLCSSKAVFVLAACALWQWRQLPVVVLGFLAPNAVALGWMALQGSAADYYRQVWQWGGMYASDTFITDPLEEGLKRTANWAGFQAALVVGAAVAWARDREWRMWIWAGLSLVGVILGLRFFPRYYFLLLPPMSIAAARGWTLLLSGSRKPTVWAALLVVLLLVPALRFGPAYMTLARGGTWRDLDTDRDSREVSARLRELAKPGDTLFVWGFRPDIFVDSGLPAGTRFLESQPISGVLADRHFFSSVPSGAAFTPRNRAELVAARPTWVVDGLGLYNPAMSLDQQAELAGWFNQYAEVARTGFSILYRLR